MAGATVCATFAQCRVPPSSATNPGGIFGGSSGSALTLQSGHGIPGAPQRQARGDGSFSQGTSACTRRPRRCRHNVRTSASSRSLRPRIRPPCRKQRN
jgi:hypothetical protein